MKLYPFSALLARMKYITRWSLMHSTRPESLSEHTCDTALMAHILCLIARRYTGTIKSTNLMLDPEYAYYRDYIRGMKTGFTTLAGRCFVTFAQQDGHTYGLVILGSNSQNIFREAAELFDWAFTSPELHPAPVEAEPEKQERGGFWHKLFG